MVCCLYVGAPRIWSRLSSPDYGPVDIHAQRREKKKLIHFSMSNLLSMSRLSMSNFRFVKNLVKTVSTVCFIKPLIVKHTICARVWGTMVAAIYACLYYRIFQSMNEIKVIQTIVTLVSSVMSFRSCHAAYRSTGITSCGGSKSIASPIPTAQTHEPN